MAAAASVMCAKHPAAAAVSTCRRCGQALCAECGPVEGDHPSTESCVALALPPVQVRAELCFGLAVAALALSLLGFAGPVLGVLYPLGNPLGLVALGLTLRGWARVWGREGYVHERQVLKRALIVCGGVLLLQAPLALMLLQDTWEKLRLAQLNRQP